MKKSGAVKPADPPKLITLADLLAGSVVPVQMHLKVTIRAELPDGSKEAGTRLSPERLRELTVAARLRGSKEAPQLLEWASRSTENAVLLFVDPAAAAERAGVKLSREDLRVFQGPFDPAADVLPPGVQLSGLDVNIQLPKATRATASKKRGGRRG